MQYGMEIQQSGINHEQEVDENFLETDVSCSYVTTILGLNQCLTAQGVTHTSAKYRLVIWTCMKA